MRHTAAVLLMATTSSVWAQPASTGSGQAYPSKFICVINPAAPGGGSDLLFRTLAPKMIEALGLIAEIPSTLVTHPSLPAKNVKELIALGRAHPGALNFSSVARGTDPMGNTPEEHVRYISSEVDKWIKAACEAGITPE